MCPSFCGISQAKALNCIGIAHQEIGGTEHLQHALEYHRQHSEISDAAGVVGRASSGEEARKE